jgi:hypothetical protein
VLDHCAPAPVASEYDSGSCTVPLIPSGGEQ